ncbi:DDT domain-containing protein PTM-like isoform X2 [Malus sylvestris]|uniref:DDT domain-containing protein PTM-like isoform X2 n=1 Tax=Malus sylvestris TaxID=3752 RepID=UPI0021ACCBEC|nr:DDT domain-containing protein PTM-like isoform X2 [Malus sylvestris]
MDNPVVKKRGRPRKRKAEDEKDLKFGPEAKKRAVETRLIVLVGRYVLKDFGRSGIFLGKVVYYGAGLYRVNYEDGDCEDLESREIRGILVGDDDFDTGLNVRRKKLDDLVSKLNRETAAGLDKNVVNSVQEVDRIDSPALSDLGGGVKIESDETQIEGDDDSSSDSSEYARDRDMGFDDKPPPVPPPQLPPSSGTIGVPEQYVSHLFSVYGFLRSFSISLFLNPFTLDDFVGSLNCCAPNTLLDAIHVVLLRALRRHLDTLSSDGSEVAPKCLRCIDWNLIDTLTWPVYLVQYLTIMGYTKGPDWRGFYNDVLGKEYYLLSVGRKLIILQILCDDVLDAKDLRDELDMREESEVGIDYDAEVTNPLVSGPRRVHPRYSKTSAWKDREEVETNHTSGNANSISSKGVKEDMDDVDHNSDECRLCGMDGTLLCCDGCPSAYHTRCIGVMKLSIPEGSWYCPDCTIDKIGPTITMGTSVKGAQIFGIDSYEHIFMGTCNHLLVIKETINTEPCVRYYNQNDIPKVLKVLHSSGQHTALYSDVCKAILQYWSIPESILSFPEATETEIPLEYTKEGAKSSTRSLPLPGKENHTVTDPIKAENYVTSVSDTNLGYTAASSLNASDKIQADLPNFQSNGGSEPQERRPLIIKIRTRQKMEFSDPNGTGSQQADPSHLTHQSSVERPLAVARSTCTSGNINSSYSEHACMGAFYKPQAYINYYMHGEFAASAASKLAAISSEETRVSDSQALGNPRKVASANISLQTKAFSLTASRFFWPSSEKKLVEVPRERCGWCLSCKASVSSKRGCMLNHAALSATKGTMKTLASLHPIKNGEGNLVSIATYVLYMEESLGGLVTGPFVNENYRNQWRKQIYQGSSFRAIKALLLELEANIRTIALSGEWIKLVDDWLVESLMIQSATCSVGPTQKRGPNSRRGRKQNAIHDDKDDDCRDQSFVWWQGGKLSKLIFQRAILSFSLVKKAARQGGWKKIPGISYADGSEIPKRSRQSVWRAAVEMSKNASQLALQVRYLDYHLRWSDLVRPEQNLPDGKGVETDASVFRNANICDKKSVKNSTIYGVDFGSQKHLPNRVIKSIIETEESQDGYNKFWFPELRIPLYLIKEYEERVGKALLPSAEEPLNMFRKLQKQQWKVPRRDIFFYLVCKRENLDLCSCSSCQLNVLMRNAFKCSICQGYCHEDCTMSSTVSTNEEVEFLITCKQCYHAKAFTKNANLKESPTSPLHLQMQEYQTPMTVTSVARTKNYNQPVTHVKGQETRSEKKATSESALAAKRRRGICSWGIIWKKKNGQETDTDFLLNNILLADGSEVHGLYPVCHLCHMPYQSDLMYICCETCKNWYHAEAVELNESKISEVAGFKCCKCRRIKSPVCPYTDSKNIKMLENKKVHTRRSKQETVGEDSDSATISISDSKLYEPATPIFPMEEVPMQDGDPLLFSLAKVELVTEYDSEVNAQWNTAEPGPRKLPVRRGIKREEDVDGFHESNISHPGISTHGEMNYLSNSMDFAPSHVEWDASMNGFEGEMVHDYEDLNYENMEPQTVFTINELLAPDDGDQLDGFEAFADESGNLENQYTVFQDGGPDQYNIATFTDEVKSAVDMMQCQVCSLQEPSPDLSCQNCGLLIHNECSPWTESSPMNGSWKCGQCREWR